MTTLRNQERFRIQSGVFDEFTFRNLFELQSRGIYDELIGPIQEGKESKVFLAKKDNSKIIVKIYFVQNCDFNKMYEYIRQDPRYEYLKKHRRDIILAWVQREYRNLIYAQRAHISAPKPITWEQNIIVEEMIGDKDPAPALKDVIPQNPQKFLEEIIKQMKGLYQQGLVHGDLSAFNILNYKNKPFIIDFSQGTVVKTPNSEELLRRDIKNVLQFFRKLGINADVEETFIKVVGKK